MELILKRGVDYTPLIFKHPDLQNKKCYNIKQSLGYKRIQIENIMKFPFESDRVGIEYIKANRLVFAINHFYGGITNEHNLIALLVYKNTDLEDKYVIANENYFENLPTYLTRLKKYMNESNISSRTHLILWSKDRIYSEFQELINPGMNDYSPTIQQSLSNEFILQQRSLIPVRTNIEQGDYVIILSKNYSPGNTTPIGVIRQVRDHSGELFNTVEVSGREPFYIKCEIFKKTEARLATQEEITNFLNYISTPVEENLVEEGLEDFEEDEVSSEHIDEILEEVEEENEFSDPLLGTNQYHMP